MADNVLAGIEIERDVNAGEGIGYVDGALIVGRTTANSASFSASPHGLISPRTDRWWVKNVRFWNFDFGNAAALGSCPHCFFPPSTDTDARTVKFEGIWFDEATVPVKIRYQFPYRAIFYDADGSLTGRGPGAWATSDWTHNRVWTDDCELVDEYGGLLCHPGVTVRRLHISGYKPGSLEGKDLYLLPYDDTIVGNMTDAELAEYQTDTSNYSIVDYRLGGWTVPVVTGHRLYVRWSYGLDFTKMRFEIIDWLWEPDVDADIELEIPFWDQREAIHVDDNKGTRHENGTFTHYATADLRTGAGRPGNAMGAHVIYNATAE